MLNAHMCKGVLSFLNPAIQMGIERLLRGHQEAQMSQEF